MHCTLATPYPETCGGELIATTTAQQFASPGFTSGGYSDGLTCVWNIVSFDGSPVFLSFYNFELEGLYLGQCVDSVTVSEGRSYVPLKSKTILPKNLENLKFRDFYKRRVQ